MSFSSLPGLTETNTRIIMLSNLPIEVLSLICCKLERKDVGSLRLVGKEFNNMCLQTTTSSMCLRDFSSRGLLCFNTLMGKIAKCGGQVRKLTFMGGCFSLPNTSFSDVEVLELNECFVEPDCNLGCTMPNLKTIHSHGTILGLQDIGIDDSNHVTEIHLSLNSVTTLDFLKKFTNLRVLHTISSGATTFMREFCGVLDIPNLKELHLHGQYAMWMTDGEIRLAQQAASQGVVIHIEKFDMPIDSELCLAMKPVQLYCPLLISNKVTLTRGLQALVFQGQTPPELQNILNDNILNLPETLKSSVERVYLSFFFKDCCLEVVRKELINLQKLLIGEPDEEVWVANICTDDTGDADSIDSAVASA